MKATGFIVKSLISYTCTILAICTLIAIFFSLNGSLHANTSSIFSDVFPQFFLVFVLPSLVILMLFRFFFLFPLVASNTGKSSHNSYSQKDTVLSETSTKRVLSLPFLSHLIHTAVFSIAVPLAALCFGKLDTGFSFKIVFYILLGAALSGIVSSIQTNMDNRLKKKMLNTFRMASNIIYKEKTRSGLFSGIVLPVLMTSLFCLLFMIGDNYQLHQADRFKSELIDSVAKNVISAGQAKQLSEEFAKTGELPVGIPAGVSETFSGSNDSFASSVLTFAILLLLCITSVLPFTADLRQRILYHSILLDNILHGKDYFHKRITVINQDELGELSLKLNIFIDKFKEILESIFSSTDSVTQVSGSLDSSLSNASAAIEEMVTTIKQITANADTQSQVVETIRGKVEEMLIGIDGTSIDVGELSSFVQETSSAMHETTVSIQTISKNTEQVNDLANKLVHISKDGNVSVTETIESIKEIEKASAQVKEIVGIISNIAAQTNLLSINASI
ncbi:MAG: hypothetical protein EHM28_09985, partial [Spirochaetaceae bacterium]